jgi:hypothetical protein
MALLSEVVKREVRLHRFGRRVLGRLHGDRLADPPFRRRMRDGLIPAGRAGEYHVLPRTGWVDYHADGSGSADKGVELFRMDYERLAARGEKH